MINERISKWRKMMAKRNIDAYIVPSSDPHQSEYLADYYKTREFILPYYWPPYNFQYKRPNKMIETTL